MIAVLAPYTHNEVTIAALHVADLAMASGRKVLVVGCGQLEKHVHPFWDKRILRSKSTAVLKGTSKANTVIHFQASEKMFSRSSVIAEVQNRKQQHVLVCTEHGVMSADPTMLYSFHKIVSATEDGKLLLRKILDPNMAKRIVHVPWHPCIAPTKRTGRLSKKQVRICFYCDAPTVDYCGPFTLRVIEHALESYDNAIVTVVHTKRWCRDDYRRLKTLHTEYGERIVIKHLMNLDEYAVECQRTDWVALPSLRSYFGLPATIALSCGAPVIANDIEPYRQIIDTHGGLLVQCALYQGEHSAATAIPNLGRWFVAMDKALQDDRILVKTQAQEWKLAELKDKFTATWEKIFLY